MKSQFLWILDNGHGIDTKGKHSPKLPDGRQLFEYEFNRAVVSHLLVLLEGMEIPARRLVPEEEDVSLGIRVRRAKETGAGTPCVLVSVHSNAFGDGNVFTDPRGIESYYFETSLAGCHVAEVFQEHLVRETGWTDRGVKGSRFYLLEHCHIPAVLTETGFYTHREEVNYLLDPDWRVRIAQAHAEAICEIEQHAEVIMNREYHD